MTPGNLDEFDEFAEEDAWYSDDPSEERKVSLHTKLRNFSPIVVVIVAAVYFLPTTIGGKITISSGGGIEFGQGVTQTVACSGNIELTITPRSSFVNSSSSGGTHYFKSVAVSGIPNSCKGADFTINAYGESDSQPLALFNATSTSAVVYNNAGTFVAGIGGQGLTVASGAGSFTAEFTTPVAVSTSVFKITIQSSVNKPIPCNEGGVCSVGDRGPGGGTVFYVSANAFTETGAPCGSTCRYLEAAPNTWYGGSSDPGMPWSPDTKTATGVTGTGAIGVGFSNTNTLIALNSTPGYAMTAARAYRGPNNLTDWFLPSYYEMDQLAFYANARGNVGFQSWYWVSSEQTADAAWVRMVYNGQGYQGGWKSKHIAYYVRPIRAF